MNKIKIILVKNYDAVEIFGTNGSIYVNHNGYLT